MLQTIDVSLRETQALVLSPTRELATQIATAVEPLAKAVGLTVTTIFGGVGQNPQVKALAAGACLAASLGWVRVARLAVAAAASAVVAVVPVVRVAAVVAAPAATIAVAAVATIVADATIVAAARTMAAKS